MEKLCLSEELLDENELRDISQHYPTSSARLWTRLALSRRTAVSAP
jgi:hypothetical protein